MATRPALTQHDLLRRRCASALAHHRRRARREGATVPYSLGELVALAMRSPACVHCRRPVGLDLHFDHFAPTSRGGPWELANLGVSCPRCNWLKGKLDAQEFALLLAFLDGLHPAAAEDLMRRLLAGAKVYRGRGRGVADVPFIIFDDDGGQE